ncbi:MAG: hypothetical protein IT446_08435 [Phycisphaerales bacterium]|nr:hypothetical protein [Phycisphaerales bacterium]
MATRRSKSLMGWLGRQVGHVRQAMATTVEERKIYRRRKVQQQPMPGRPDVMVRRTVIDEVIVKKD